MLEMLCDNEDFYWSKVGGEWVFEDEIESMLSCKFVCCYCSLEKILNELS